MLLAMAFATCGARVENWSDECSMFAVQLKGSGCVRRGRTDAVSKWDRVNLFEGGPGGSIVCDSQTPPRLEPRTSKPPRDPSVARAETHVGPTTFANPNRKSHEA